MPHQLQKELAVCATKENVFVQTQVQHMTQPGVALFLTVLVSLFVNDEDF